LIGLRARELFGTRVEFETLERGVLEVTAFERPRDYGKHFKAYYGPTIAARASRCSTCSRWGRGDSGRGGET